MEKIMLAAAATLVTLGSALAWQMPWREYPGQDNIAIPADYQEKTEWVFARLMYPPYSGPSPGPSYRMRYGGDWKHGRSSWTTDYTAADRNVSIAMRRLTRVHVRSVEQPVGRVHRHHAARFSGPPDRGYSRQRSDFPFYLRPG